MKKVFTLIVAAVMAASVNAQDFIIQGGEGTTYAEAKGSIHCAYDNTDLASPSMVTCESAPGFIGYLMKSGKAFSNGNFLNYNGKLYRTLKISNGAVNKFIIPEGVTISKIEIIGYCNGKEGTTSYFANLAVEESSERTINVYSSDGTKDILYRHTFAKNERNWDVMQDDPEVVTIDRLSLKDCFYLKNGGAQPCFIINLYKAVEGSDSKSVSVGSEGYITHAASFNVDYSAAGLEAYSVKYADGKLSFNKINGVVKAGKAVILKGDAKDYTLAEAEGEATDIDTDLKASDGKTTGAENIYCLANKNQGLGFYQVSSSVTIPANKAYLEIPASAGARTFYSMEFGGGTTGINALQANGAKANSAIYSLSGQQVSKAYKGIVIVNGKKMIQK